jgi:hypothetical protein
MIVFMMWAPLIRAKVVRGAAAFGNCTIKKYRGIRYGFRPKSYWAETDPLSAILRNVTGENRRQMITDYWASGRIDELDIALLQDEVDASTRTRLGRIHPSFIGGEYLAPYLPGEVEIAKTTPEDKTKNERATRRACISNRGVAEGRICSAALPRLKAQCHCSGRELPPWACWWCKQGRCEPGS